MNAVSAPETQDDPLTCARVLLEPAYQTEMNAARPELHDFLQNAIEDAFRTEMARLMAGSVTCHPERQHEWLATAEQVLGQRLLALAWNESQKTILTQPAQPVSAA